LFLVLAGKCNRPGIEPVIPDAPFNQRVAWSSSSGATNLHSVVLSIGFLAKRLQNDPIGATAAAWLTATAIHQVDALPKYREVLGFCPILTLKYNIRKAVAADQFCSYCGVSQAS
jgi:glucose-6-phosphate dehydrogenase assembly protein OpcA